MREMIVGNWRTTLLGVCLLVALLMYTQGKINSYEFLAVMGFFNVGGFLLARDARQEKHPDPADPPPAPASRRLSRFDRMVGEVAYRLLVAFILVVLALCFYPLLRDALADRTTPRTYTPGSGGSYGSPYSSPIYSPGYTPAAQPSQPVPAGAPPAQDDEPPHPATGPGPGLAH